MPEEPEIPPYTSMLYPTLEALDVLGGSATNDELDEAVVRIMGISDAQLAVEYPAASMQTRPKVTHRIAWARTYLKKMELVDNSRRGIWSLRPEGKSFLGHGPDAGAALLLEMDREIRRNARLQSSRTTPTNTGLSRHEPSQGLDAEEDSLVEEPESDPGDWRDVLLTALRSMTPDGFERLAQRLLREAGFRNVEVLGRSGDGGLDVVGVYKLSLVSFTVFAQCKRYEGTVSASAIRDFRGAMSGRGEKGLLITTGSFTSGAVGEASRDGAPPVELVDGRELCDLLRSFEIGVRTVVRQIESIEVEETFFESL